MNFSLNLLAAVPAFSVTTPRMKAQHMLLCVFGMTIISSHPCLGAKEQAWWRASPLDSITHHGLKEITISTNLQAICVKELGWFIPGKEYYTQNMPCFLRIFPWVSITSHSQGQANGVLHPVWPPWCLTLSRYAKSSWCWIKWYISLCKIHLSELRPSKQTFRTLPVSHMTTGGVYSIGIAKHKPP